MYTKTVEYNNIVYSHSMKKQANLHTYY